MSQTNGRQSFSERICDDLSEVILQYLSVDDKLRLECVSKQFQRTIFEKQFDLYIGYDPQNRVKSLQGILFEGYGCLDWITFETILKKCPNIQSIVFNKQFGRNERELTFRRIISLFTKISNHLKRLDYYSFEINDKILNEFIKKFGSKIVSIQSSWNLHNQHLKCLTNLEELFICHLSQTMTHLLEIESKKLKKVCIEFIYDISEEDLISILSHFQRFQLKYFEIKYDADTNGENRIKMIKNVLKEIPMFQHLIHLKFQTYHYSEELNESLKTVFQNCTQLKSFGTSVVIRSEDGSEIRQMIAILREMKRLKRLEIICYDINQNPNVNNWFTSEEWKQLSNISHLILKLPYRDSLNEDFVTEIDTTLPKLQYLSIGYRLATEPNGSTKMADILSGLSRLETIKLLVNNEFVCNQIKEKVIEKCKKIRVIDIKVRNFE